MIDEDEIKLAPRVADWLQGLLICSTFPRIRTSCTSLTYGIQYFTSVLMLCSEIVE
jgi:hypothetical protein